MCHAVRTYNESGDLVYEANFSTAEAAYTVYCDIIESMKKTLPAGHTILVARFKNNKMMTCQRIVGEA